MSDLKIVLSPPQSKFFSSKKRYTAMVCGFGCLRGDTKVLTNQGYIPIADINSAMQIVSWNDENNQYQLSPSTGAFPKGKDYLYRIVTTQGEFVANEYHQVFCVDRKYRPVHALSVGMELFSSSENLLPTTEELSQLTLPEDVQHYYRIISDCLGDYGELARQYGQQLLLVEDNDLSFVPSLDDALRLLLNYVPSDFEHKDGQREQLQSHIHHGEYIYPLQIGDSAPHSEHLWGLLADYIASLSVERTFQDNLQSGQFLLNNVYRHIEILLNQHHISDNLSWAFDNNSYTETINRNYILSIEKLDVKEAYYDLHVHGTNNYVTEDGTIHHNSGKTYAGTVRLLSSVIQHPSMNFLYCAPTLSLVRDIFYPLVGEILGDLGLKYTINRSENIVFIEDHGQIFCRSMERPELLVGFSVGDVLLDEWDLVTIDRGTQVLNKVSARMRQRFPDGKKNQLYVTTTPEGFKQTYINFKKNPLEDSMLIKASTYSNAENLPDDYIPSLKSQYPSQLIEAYLNGEFVNLTSGTVYFSFDREKEICTCSSVYRDGEEIHCGVDFNVLDCSVTVGVKRYKDNVEELHIIDGLYHLNDTNEMAEVLRNKYPRSPIFIYPDSSGKSTSSKSANQSDFTILKKAGFHLRARSKNPLIKERVMSVNGALEHGKVRINLSKCKELVESLEQQVYNENTGQPEKLVNNSIDDINDSFGYLVHFLYPIKKINSQRVSIIGF